MEILVTAIAIYFGINILILASALALDWKGAKPFIGEIIFIGLPRLIQVIYTKRF